MSKRRKSKNELVEVLKGYFSPSAGQVPVLLVDTGALIDLEERAREERSGAPHKVAAELFKELGSLAEYTLFPVGIYNEIEQHHLKSRKNGRPEIGNEMYEAVRQYRESSSELLGRVQFDYFYSELYKNEVDRLQEAVNGIHREVNSAKKVAGKDSISENDLELINTALRLSVKSAFEFRLHQKNEGDVPDAIEGTYRVAVVSPDSHIYKPLNTLITRPEGVSYRDYLQAFNTREYS